MASVMLTMRTVFALLLCIPILAGCGDDPTSSADMDVLEDFAGDGSLLCGATTCADDQGCCDYTCVDLATDTANCGGCGVSCEATETCTDGECRCGQPACGPTDACCDFGTDDLQCIDVQADSENCGACGNDCGSGEKCLNGTCACLAGDGSYETCDGDELCCPGIGCRNLEADPTNCGACGNLCGAGELCDTGQCACGDVTASGVGTACGEDESCCGSPAQCLPEEDDACICGAARCSAGQVCCEVDAGGTLTETCVRPDSDPDHCGACGSACGTAEVCRGASCRCSGGFADCDMDTATGCESALSVDVQNCGMCGSACVSGEVCDGTGVCTLNCQAGLTNCDDNCIDVYGDERHCGACTAVCPSGEVCDGTGQCDESCQVGYTQCGNSCFDIYSDRSHCSACGVACGAGLVCDGRGQCDITCQPGFSECAGGCWNLDGNRRHCGACGNACGSGLICDGTGQCGPTCVTGYTDCGGNCVDTQSTFQHCGACGTVCSAGELCIAGQCQLTCATGQVSCNGTCIDPLNDDANCGGCERDCGVGGACVSGVCIQQCSSGREICDDTCVDTRSSDVHCGACGNACAMGDVCIGGTCMPAGSCPAGFQQCNGTCVDVDSNVFHCGVCNNSCGAFAACSNGVCGCTAGFEDCVSGDMLACDTNINFDNTFCGACGAGNDCKTGEQCQQGTCSCVQGTGNCDGMAGNGCETSTTTDLLHCGGCNMACTGSNPACVNGTCFSNWYQSRLDATDNNAGLNDVFTSCFIDGQGAVWCSGSYAGGLLGANAPPRDVDTPYQVPGLDGLDPAVHVTMSDQTACAILQSGEARCWGAVPSNECPFCVTAGVPVAVPGFDGVTPATTAVTADVGLSAIYFVAANGAVYSVGDDNDGQMGNGAGTTAHATPTAVVGIDGTSTSAVQVIAGRNWGCALIDDGAVWCWGADNVGQAGNGAASSADVDVPTTVDNIDGVGLSAIKIAKARNNICALMDTGALYCWGANPSDRLGTRPLGSTPVLSPAVHDVYAPGGPRVMDVAGGAASFCAIPEVGDVACWGHDTKECRFGHQGTAAIYRPAPLAIGGTTGMTRLYGGRGMMVGETQGGELMGWGMNYNGAFARTGFIWRPRPEPVITASGATLKSIGAMSMGAAHTCVCTPSGVFCAGSNNNQSLGVGIDDRALPNTGLMIPVVGLSGCTEIDVGGGASCARLSSGKLRCWGSGAALPSVDLTEPLPVDALVFDGINVSAAQVDLAWIHGCAVDTTGAVWCWGNDREGALGNGTGSHTDPEIVEVIDGVTVSATRVDVGEEFSCALTTTGAVYCWGINQNGTVGDGTFTQRQVPTLVSGIDGVGKVAIDVSAGSRHACAVLSTGAVECWGNNAVRQLGTTATGSVNVPVQVTDIDGTTAAAVQVAAGRSSTCALMTDGTVRCWGDFRQLGQSGLTTGNIETPQTIENIDGTVLQAIEISANEGTWSTAGDFADSTCALLSNGETWCWGRDFEGAHGAGGILDACYPVNLGYQP